MVGEHTELANAVVGVLIERGVTIAVAESLTGGALCSQIVDVPGASAVLRGGVVSYATDLKHKILGVSAALLREGGPVQREVAAQMATGVAQLCDADYGVATTGIAGPGDSPDGPEGLVYVAMYEPGSGKKPMVLHLRLDGDREEVRSAAVWAALELILLELDATDARPNSGGNVGTGGDADAYHDGYGRWPTAPHQTEDPYAASERFRLGWK